MVARRSNCMIAACYAMPGLLAIRPRPLKTLQTSNGNKSEASRFKGALAPPDHILFTTMSEASELGSKAKGIFVTLASGAGHLSCLPTRADGNSRPDMMYGTTSNCCVLASVQTGGAG
eukprot:3105455-Rhodomonas_salina.4